MDQPLIQTQSTPPFDSIPQQAPDSLTKIINVIHRSVLEKLTEQGAVPLPLNPDQLRVSVECVSDALKNAMRGRDIVIDKIAIQREATIRSFTEMPQAIYKISQGQTLPTESSNSKSIESQKEGFLPIDDLVAQELQKRTEQDNRLGVNPPPLQPPSSLDKKINIINVPFKSNLQTPEMDSIYKPVEPQNIKYNIRSNNIKERVVSIPSDIDPSSTQSQPQSQLQSQPQTSTQSQLQSQPQTSTQSQLQSQPQSSPPVQPTAPSNPGKRPTLLERRQAKQELLRKVHESKQNKSQPIIPQNIPSLSIAPSSSYTSTTNNTSPIPHRTLISSPPIGSDSLRWDWKPDNDVILSDILRLQIPQIILPSYLPYLILKLKIQPPSNPDEESFVKPSLFSIPLFLSPDSSISPNNLTTWKPDNTPSILIHKSSVITFFINLPDGDTISLLSSNHSKIGPDLSSSKFLSGFSKQSNPDIVYPITELDTDSTETFKYSLHPHSLNLFILLEEL
jgi:hypothetical protein